jgi:hypothetical protein
VAERRLGDTESVDARDRHLGPIAVVDRRHETLAVDFGELIRKLVLFDRVIVESRRFRELAPLVQKFGYYEVRKLLQSGRINLVLDTLTVGSLKGSPYGPMPLGSYVLGAGTILASPANLEADLAGSIGAIAGLSAKRAEELRALVLERLVRLSETTGDGIMDGFNRDLAMNAPVLRTAIADAARREYARSVDPAELTLNLERTNDYTWRTDTNLAALTRLSAERVHNVVEKGLVAAGHLTARLKLMEVHQAVTGFRDDELSLVEDKLTYLARLIDPDAQLQRFARVIELFGLPNVDLQANVHDVDLPRLLEILEDGRTHSFRQWLRTIDSLDDEDVKAEIHRLRDFLRQAIRGPAGKSVRFLATTSAGMASLGAGIGLSTGDSFVIERFVSKPGPTAFLSQLYPSMFTVAY